MDADAGRKKGIGHCRDYLSERQTISRQAAVMSIPLFLLSIYPRIAAL
jgi:hypothetical protein